MIGEADDLRTVFTNRFAFPDDGDLITMSIADMPINTVVAQICCPTNEPTCIWAIPLQHLLEGGREVELLGGISPEAFWIIDGALPEFLVLLHRRDPRAANRLGKAGGGVEDAIFMQDGFDSFGFTHRLLRDRYGISTQRLHTVWRFRVDAWLDSSGTLDLVHFRAFDLSMSTEQQQPPAGDERIDKIVEALLLVSPEDLDAEMLKLCGGDAELIGAVRSVLETRHGFVSETFLVQFADVV